MEENANIIQTGPLSYKDLQELNGQKFENPPVDYDKLTPALAELLKQHNERDYSDNTQINRIMRQPGFNADSRVYFDTQGVGDYYNPEVASLGFEKGRSFSGNEMQHLSDIKAEEQSGWAQLFNGVTKGIVNAGTTYVDSMVGLPYGIATAIMDGKFSNVWNNEISQTAREINQAVEEALPNYETEAEQNMPWYHKMGKMNFIADGLLKNALGFQLGAMYSGQTFNAALRGLGILKGPMAAKIVGTIYGAVNEGRMEAGNMYDDMMRLDIQKIDDAYLKAAEEIRNSNIDESEKARQMKDLNEAYNKQIEDADERNSKAGNLDLALNIAILSLTDFFTIGNLYARGFDTARSMAGERMARRGLRSTMRNLGEGVAKAEADDASTIIKNGFNYELKKQFQKPVLQGIWSGLKTGIGEGNEEMAQQFASVFSGNVFSYDNPDAYYLSFINPEQVEKTKSGVFDMARKGFWDAMGEGVRGSYGDMAQWEQFAVGFLSAAMGRPTFGRANNMAQDTWLGKGKTIGLSGGIFGNVRSNMAAAREVGESVEVMNRYVQRINDNARYFTQNNSFTEAMNEQAVAGDKFEWNNMKDNLDFAAVAHFAKMGRLQDLKDLVHNDLARVSDDELRQIAQNFTPTDSKYSGWKNADGSFMWETEDGRKAMREQIAKREEQVLRGIDDYERIVRQVRGRSNNGLSEDQVEELAWYNWKSKQFQRRSDSLITENNELFDRLNAAIMETLPKWRERKEQLEQDVKANPEGKTDGMTNKEQLENITANINDFEKLGEILRELQTERGNARIEFDADFAKTMNDLFGEEGVKELNDFLGTRFEMDEFDNLRTAFNDLYRMNALRTQFMERYMDFMKNPAKLMSNREKVKQKVGDAMNKAKDHVEARRNANKSKEKIKDEVINGDMTQEDIDKMAAAGYTEEADFAQSMKDSVEESMKKRDKLTSVIEQINDEVGEDVYNMVDPIFIDIAEINLGTDPLQHLQPEYWDKKETRDFIASQHPELDEQGITDLLLQYKEQARRIKERMDKAVSPVEVKREDVEKEPKPVAQGGKDPAGDVPVETPKKDKEEKPQNEEDKAWEKIEKQAGNGVSMEATTGTNASEELNKEHNVANEVLTANQGKAGGVRTIAGEYPYETTIQGIATKGNMPNLAKMKIRPVTENGERPFWALFAVDKQLLGNDVNDDNFDERVRDFAARYLDGNETFPDNGNKAWADAFKQVKAFYHTFNYLTDKGAFIRRDIYDKKGKNGIHYKMKVRLAVDFDLNAKAGCFVVLVTDENGNVLGDVGDTFHHWALNNASPNLFDDIMKAAQKSGQTSGLWFTDYTSTIDTINSGTLPFVRDKDGKPVMHSLNEVFATKQIGIFGYKRDDGTQPILGISPTQEEFFKEEEKILNVARNTKGRAFVIIPQRGGRYAIVSFTMPMYNYEKHKGTKLVRFVGHVVRQQMEILNQQFHSKEELMKAPQKANDILEKAAIALSGFVPYQVRLFVDETGDIRMAYRPIERRAQFKNVPFTIRKVGNAESFDAIGKDANPIVESILKAWDNEPFQVNYGNQVLGGVNKTAKHIGRSEDYNTMIGEIAEVNLPVGYEMMRNIWFTLGGIAKEKGSGEQVKAKKKPQQKEKPVALKTEQPSPTKTEEQKEHDAKVKQYGLQIVRYEQDVDDILKSDGFDDLDDQSWALLLQYIEECRAILANAIKDGVEWKEIMSDETTDLFAKIKVEAAKRGHKVEDTGNKKEHAEKNTTPQPTEEPLMADVRQMELPSIDEMRVKLTEKKQNGKIYEPAKRINFGVKAGNIKLTDENIEMLYRISLMLTEEKFADLITTIDDRGKTKNVEAVYKKTGERLGWKPLGQQRKDVQKAVASDAIESQVEAALGRLGIKSEPMTKEEVAEVFRQGLEHAKGIFGDELLVDEEAMQYLRENGLVDEQGKITDTQLMSRGSIEMLQRALKEKGIVKSNLANASLTIIPSIGHPFNLDQKTTSLKKEVLEYAKKEGIVGTMTAEETAKGVAINISNDSIDKFVDDSSNNKSISKEIHLSVLPVIRDVIRESIEAEVHPDYVKVNGIRTTEKHNPDGLIHRCYGAIEIEDKVYRVKITLKENLTNGQNQKAYSYEVANVELLDDKTERPSNDSQTSERAVLTISGAKLLKDVEKSYDKGKKLLDESENNGIELLSTSQGTIHGFQHNGRIGLFTNEIDPSAPIHEYTHAWDGMMQHINPEFWAKGVQLMMTETKDLWDAVANDPNYGKSAEWLAKSEAERNNLIASEVHSRLVGGAYVAYASQKKGGIIQWLKDFFKELANAFGWNSERISRMTLDELVNATITDFANGLNPNDMSTDNEYHVVRPVYDEMVAIREEAKKNGTFMKAPNGEPTNLLNERQWLQVRTKNFIRWFGDWLNVNRFNTSAIDTSRVDIEEVEENWKDNPDKKNKKLRIYLKGQHEKGYFELVKDEEFAQYSVHFKTGNADTQEIYGSTKAERKVLFEELIKAIPDGATVSTWGNVSDAGLKGLNNVGRNMTKIGERTVKDRQGNDRTIPIYQKGEGVSKVVDENGEPLVVYHGSDNYGFNIFKSKDYRREASYFSTSKLTAFSYVSYKTTSIDAANNLEEGTYEKLWEKYNSIRYSKKYKQGDEEAIKEANEIAKSIDLLINPDNPISPAIYNVFINSRNPKIIDAEGETWKKLHPDRYEKYLDNYDSVIIKNFIDTGHRGIKTNEQTTIAVIDPNQIKSATDNNGLFDESNPNINLLINQTQPQEEFTKAETQMRKPVIRHLAATMPNLNREGQVSLANALLRTNDRYGEFDQLLNDMATLRANDANSQTYYDAFNNVARLLMGDEDWKAMAGNDQETMENLIDQYRHYLRFGMLPQVPASARLFRQMKHVMGNTQDNEFALRDAYRQVHKKAEPHVHIRTASFGNRIPVKFQLGHLNVEQKEYLKLRGIEDYEYEMMSGQERERLLRCMA